MEWEDLFELGFGELSLKPNEFWRLTLVEFQWMVTGFWRRDQHQWRHTRDIVAMIRNVNSKDNVKPMEMYPLAIDDELSQANQVEPLTKEEMDSIVRKWEERKKKKAKSA